MAVVDQVTLGHREDEIAARDVDLSGTELLCVQAARRRGDDVLHRVRAGGDEGVRHSRDGQVLVGLAASIAGNRVVLLAGSQPVVHVTDEDAVLDQDVSARRHALVVDTQRPPPAGQRAVVDGGDDGARDRLADLASEDGRSLADKVGFEPMPTGLVEEHTAELIADDDRHLASGRRRRVEQGNGALRRGPRILGGRGVVEEFEATLHPRCLHRRLNLAVALGDGVHHQADAGAGVGVMNPFGSGDQHLLGALAIADRNLLDRAAHGASRLVRFQEQLDLCLRANGLRRHIDPLRRPRCPAQLSERKSSAAAAPDLRRQVGGLE